MYQILWHIWTHLNTIVQHEDKWQQIDLNEERISKPQGVEQQNLHKAVACHTLSLPLLITEVLVLQVLRMNPSEVY